MSFFGPFRTWDRRWVRTALIGLLVVGSDPLFYWGYCWGWWARDSLIVQGLFQCSCPAQSELVRYAPFEVLSSGCGSDRYMRIAPGGHTLSHLRTASGQQVVTFINLDTGQPIGSVPIRAVASPGFHMTFVGDDLTLLEVSPGQFILFEVATQRVIPIKGSSYSPNADGALIMPPVDPTRDRVILDDEALLVLRHTDGNISSESTVIAFWAHYLQAVQRQLDQQQTPYQLAPESPEEGQGSMTSANGRWQASREGIREHASERYLVTTWQQQISFRNFQPVRWIAGDRGAIYNRGPQYVIPSGPLNRGYFLIEQPILLLLVPQDEAP